MAISSDAPPVDATVAVTVLVAVSMTVTEFAA